MAVARPSVDQYFMDMTQLVKSRGSCPRRQVGAVIVKDKRVLTTGYNGAPRNFPHPIDVGCLRDELQIPKGMMADICPCLHAEQNAILQAATTGVSIEGADLYCTTQPCTQCSRMLANCGIKKVVFAEAYPDPLAVGILTTAGVEMYTWDATNKKTVRLKGNTFEQAQDELRRKWKAGEFHASPTPGAVIGARLPVIQGGEAVPSPRSFAHPPAPKAPGELDSGDEAPAPLRRGVPAQPAAARPSPPLAPDDAVVESDPSHATRAAGVRDLRDDPRRAELIRKLAKEKAERQRQQREQNQR